MATPAQIRANRQNAQKSTGPKTPDGKSAVAQNAITHGLSSARLTIPGEDSDRFDHHRRAMLKSLDPVGPMESMLAERIATLSWRLTRINRFQSAAINTLADKTEAESKSLLGQFLSPKKHKPSTNVTPDLIRGPGQNMDSLLGDLAVKDFANTRVLERLLMYERRIENSLYKTHLELQKCQLLRLRKETIQQEDSHND